VIASDFVGSGIRLTMNGGDLPMPSQVNCRGSVSPDSNAGLELTKAGFFDSDFPMHPDITLTEVVPNISKK
jgi:hypothetical protein